jgi:hypothetical protein
MRLVVVYLAASSAVQALDFEMPPTLLASSVPIPSWHKTDLASLSDNVR